MASLNKVQLIGNLGADPDIRSLGNGGDKVANFRIATTEKWKDKASGEKRERTEWHTVVVFGGAVGVVEQYLKKGSPCYVEGQLQTRKWQDQSGADRYSTEIVIKPYVGSLILLGGGSGGGGERYASHQDGRGAGGGAGSGSGFGGGASGPAHYDDLNDDVPF